MTWYRVPAARASTERPLKSDPSDAKCKLLTIRSGDALINLAAIYNLPVTQVGGAACTGVQNRHAGPSGGGFARHARIIQVLRDNADLLQASLDALPPGKDLRLCGTNLVDKISGETCRVCC